MDIYLPEDQPDMDFHEAGFQRDDSDKVAMEPPSDGDIAGNDELESQEEQLYQGMIWRNGSSTQRTTDGKRRYVTKACDHSYGRVHELCKKLAKEWPREIPLKLDGRGFCVIPKQKLGLLYRIFPRFLDDYLPHYVYSPYLNEAYELAKTFGFLNARGGRGEKAFLWGLPSVEALAECNRYFRELGAIFDSREFKNRKLWERKRASTRIEHRLHGLISSIFGRHFKIMVLRVDLEYGRADHSLPVDLFATERLPDGFRLNRVHDDFKRFRNGLRQLKWTKHLLGYAWRLEFGRQRGYHIHFMAFFNGSEVCNDIHYADLFIVYWKQVAGQYAQGWNCNAEKFGYRHVGIGIIDRNDKVVIGNLMFAASYLAKEAELLEAKVAEHMRTFDASRPLPARRRKAEVPLGEDSFVPQEFIPEEFDSRVRYTATFCRDMAVNARNLQQKAARQYLRTHELPTRRKAARGRTAIEDHTESL